MEFLSVEQILAADDIPSEVVDVPEWGGKVKVKGLTRGAFDRVNKASEIVIPATGPGQRPTTQRDEGKFAEMLFLECVVEPKFNEEHIAALADKSVAALNRVYEAISRVIRTDVDAAKKG
jgi:hypothetical protein